MQDLEQKLQQIRKLQFNFKVEECKSLCLELLQTSKESLPELKTICGFCEQFSDPKKSINTLYSVYEDSPFYFKNNTYLLHVLDQQSCEKAKKFASQLINSYEKLGEQTDIYYFLSFSMAQKTIDPENHLGTKQILLNGYTQQGSIKKNIEDQEKSFQKILCSLQKEEQAWVYHQIGKEILYKFFLDQEDQDIFNECATILKNCLQVQPNNTLAMQLLAMLYVQNEQNKTENLLRALEIYNKALKINSNDQQMKVYLCEVLIELDQFEECDDILEGIVSQKQTPFLFNKYLQYVSFSYQYRFKDQNIDFENLFRLLMQTIEYDGEDYYNFDSFYLLVYLVQLSKSFIKQKEQIEKALEYLSMNDPKIQSKLKQLVGFEPQLQEFLNVFTKKIQESIQQIYTLAAYQKEIEPQITYMSRISHWDNYFN
ncbi:hypothetical protein TTHERM_00926940 (macronuclear) [Tetrahymena thermophila SB210]|uniref:Tetratricopeptide repeat protein n=1 Tax=Tetrahymena thermophila (strain SB210) TaxID=312017 RepID=Q22DW5_TETTS|nr:hypothetical protein TTHERM_00926940 [Tetrahymena thermophila SB210]EAR83440.1 hypothetical protein TTHERM_00926940 [Tetrahymena thermophila SB210]|eukprot:XP_001031103.1 hypothetical protein TTHERM_00926940 [Tetrahymena thermophila SB210]